MHSRTQSEDVDQYIQELLRFLNPTDSNDIVQLPCVAKNVCALQARFLGLEAPLPCHENGNLAIELEATFHRRRITRLTGLRF
jgi:hypothetical protein